MPANPLIWGQVASWAASDDVILWGDTVYDPSGNVILWGDSNTTDDYVILWGDSVVTDPGSPLTHGSSPWLHWAPRAPAA